MIKYSKRGIAPRIYYFVKPHYPCNLGDGFNQDTKQHRTDRQKRQRQ